VLPAVAYRRDGPGRREQHDDESEAARDRAPAGDDDEEQAGQRADQQAGASEASE
jgi:hypothetical protein